MDQQNMKDCKVIVLPIDTDITLADRLVEGINECTGSGIAMRCDGWPKGILRKADKYGIERVVFYGSKELDSGKAGVRDMAKKTQEEIPIGDLIGYFATIYRA